MSRAGRGATSTREPSRRARRVERAPSIPAASLDPIAIVVLLGLGLLLLLAAPDEPTLWGLNGFRTVSGAWPGLVLAALAGLGLAIARPRPRWIWTALGIALALGLAFPLRERIHVLGDTQLRLRAMYAAGSPALSSEFTQSWARLHANPLDIVMDVLVPQTLHAGGLTLLDSVSVTGALLGLAYLALAWRLASRLAPEPGTIGPLALAVVLTGMLEAFAGYADSAGLVAVVALGWWTEILAPIERPAQAWRVAGWLALLLLSHRMALVMLAPQLLRLLGPGIVGDRREARRLALGLTALVVAGVAIAAAMSGAGRQLGADLAELARSARGFAVHPADVLSALVLAAPLALLAPALAGREGARFLREPPAWWVAVGAAPLLAALIWVFPVGPSGLGAHRDWDTNVLLGVTLTVGAAAWLARAGASRLVTGLAAALPLLALISLGWVAVNADRGLATRRAIQLATSPTALTEPQRAHLHYYFGQRAMDEGEPGVAAQHYDKAFELGGNPRRALLAAEAWRVAGDPARARADLARARAAGPLSPELERGAAVIEAQLPATLPR